MHFDKENSMELEDMMKIVYVTRPEGVYQTRMIIPHSTSSRAGTLTR